jgi:hypothetical protein
MNLVTCGVQDNDNKRYKYVLRCAVCQQIEHGIFNNVECFKKEEIYRFGGRNDYPLPGGKKENNAHPHNHRTPRADNLHFSSIAFRFSKISANDKTPSPNPTNANEIIYGTSGRI